MLRYLINFVYPPRCAACGARMGIDAIGQVCEACIALIERVPEPMCQVCGIPLQPGSPPPFPDAAESTPGEAQRSRARQAEQSAAEQTSPRGAHIKKESATCAYRNGGGAVYRCRQCAESPPHFGRARAIARYRPGISEDGQVVPSLIRRHKYGRDQSLSRALAQCLGESLPLDGENYDLVVPVPLHRRRLRWRGFNQAALLGIAVARNTGCTLDVVTLARIRDTSPQTSLHSTQRRLNVRGAFAVTQPSRIANRSVLLVDDVMTTGATLDECAHTLLAAGARRVDVLTLARAV